MFTRPQSLLLLCAALFSSHLLAAPPVEKRVPLPNWDEAPAGIFFKDAFVEALSGKRPASLRTNDEPRDTVSDTSQAVTPPPANSGSDWSKLISATTIEDEVKAIKIDIDKIVTTPSKFRGGGYRDARMQFSIAAMMFGISAEYGKETRWQATAGGVRDLFARAASNCKVGDIRAYNEAKQRKSDLQDLVSGARIAAPEPNRDATWEQLVHRSPLMQRLKIAHQERVVVWTASDKTFKEKLAQVAREAELIAAMSHLLKQDEMEDTGDETYEGYCDEMKDGARSLLNAVNDKKPEAARKAAGAIGQACDRCHDDYRG